MPITLVTTAGASNANSYATESEAQAYIDSHFVTPAVVAKWNALSTDQRASALIRATQLLDQYIVWVGEIGSDEQSLSWPRESAYDRYGREIGSAVIPLFVKEFQIETMLWIVNQSGTIPESLSGGEFDSIKVGTIEVNFNEVGAAKKQSLPDIVISALAPMGKYSAATLGGVQNIKLLRV